MIVADLFALLIGGPISSSYGDPQLRQLANDSPGVLRRLAQSFQGDPCGSQNALAVPAAATRLTVPDMAQSALVAVEGASVRVTFDGSAVSAVNGVTFISGAAFTITGRPSMQGAQFFQVAAGAIIQVAYFT